MKIFELLIIPQLLSFFLYLKICKLYVDQTWHGDTKILKYYTMKVYNILEPLSRYIVNRNILSRVLLTKDGVRIGNWIY
jgi:hypothetical protein